MSDQGVESKFHSQADDLLGKDSADALLEWCWSLDAAPNLNQLADLIEVRP
jgi:hypothetical protein